MTLVANPILPGCHPDPSICRVGEDYYLVTSTFEYFPGLPIFHSTDLNEWRQIGHAVDRLDQISLDGLPSSSGLYAPTLRHHNDLFWLVCTLVDQRGEAGGGHFLMTASDPAGPWSEPIWLEGDGIDPSLFFDDDTVWLHATRPARDPEWPGQTEIWLREYDVQEQRLRGPEQVLWSGALRGAVWAEGPHLYRVDGRYYLVAAEGGTEHDHAISVARADSITGPYEGSPRNPVLTHRHLGRDSPIVGVGHADMVQASDGSWWATVLGMRPYGGYHYNLGRETFLVPVRWEDGWPVFAPGLGRVTDTVDVPFALPPNARPTSARDEVVRPGDLRWNSLRGPWQRFADAEGEGWTIRLSPQTLRDAGTPAFLGIRQQSRDVDFTARLVAELATGEEAGVVVRQSEETHARLCLTGPPSDGLRRVVALQRVRGGEQTLGETTVPASGAVTLGIHAQGQRYEFTVTYGKTTTTVAVADGRQLDSVSAGGFLGLWLGIYGTSNGRSTETVARFERVCYAEGGAS